MLIFHGVPEMEGVLMLIAGHVGGGETPLDTRVSKNAKKGEHQIGGA